MTLIDTTHHAEYNRILTLQKHLELVQNDNQQLKETLSDREGKCRRDLDYLESKLKECSKDNKVLYNTQQRLELELYTKNQDIGALQKEAQHWKRLYKDLDKSISMERQEFARQQDSWVHQESELINRLQHLQHSQKQQHQQQQQQQQQQQKNNSRRHDLSLSSPNLSQQSSSIDIPYLSNQQTLLSLQKTITQLKLDSAQQADKFRQQHILAKNENRIKVSQLMDQINSTTKLSQSLMEDNEAYRLLLHEKTLDDDFIADSYVQVNSDDVYLKHLDAKRNPQILHQKKKIDDSIRPNKTRKLSLADELSIAISADHNAIQTLTLSYQEMVEEIRTLEDANQALRLYINKILMRIMNNRHMETILSIDPQNNHAATTLKITPSIPLYLFEKSPTNNAPQTAVINTHQHLSDSSTAENPCQKVGDITSSEDIHSNDITGTVRTCTGNDEDSWTHVHRHDQSKPETFLV